MRHLLPAPVLLSLFAASGMAIAQPDAGQILREQQQLRPSRPAATADVSIEQPAMPVLPAAEGQGTLKVTAFRFVGDLAEVGPQELEQVVRQHVGKELSFAQLRQVADLVGQYLRGQGYSLAQAYLAAQDIEGGVVQITVLLGRIDGDATGRGIVVNTEGRPLKPRIDQERVRKTVAQTTIAESLYLKMEPLERSLLLLHDLPGIQAHAQLDPGSEPGTTRITVDVIEGPLWSGSAWIDNFGNRYTGAERVNAQINLNDPSGEGDQAILQTSVAERLHIARLGYSVPLGYEGVRAGAAYTDMRYSLGKEFAALAAEGSGKVLSADLSVPFVRSRRHSAFGSVTYDYKALRDESLGALTANKRVQSWGLVLDGSGVDDIGGGATNRYRVLFQLGELELERVAGSLSADQLGPQAHGWYNKAAFNLARLQRLSNHWSVFASASGQVADRNLDSSEKFILGGITGVRAYAPSEAHGDSGWLSSIELRYDIAGAPAFGDWQVVAFVDVGGVQLNKNLWPGWNADNPAQENSYRLSGTGLGISLIRSGSYAIRAIYAHRLGNNPGGPDADGTRDSGRFWLQSMIHF